MRLHWSGAIKAAPYLPELVSAWGATLCIKLQVIVECQILIGSDARHCVFITIWLRYKTTLNLRVFSIGMSTLVRLYFKYFAYLSQIPFFSCFQEILPSEWLPAVWLGGVVKHLSASKTWGKTPIHARGTKIMASCRDIKACLNILGEYYVVDLGMRKKGRTAA